jgi:hypothetical protein
VWKLNNTHYDALSFYTTNEDSRFSRLKLKIISLPVERKIRCFSENLVETVDHLRVKYSGIHAPSQQGVLVQLETRPGLTGVSLHTYYFTSLTVYNLLSNSIQRRLMETCTYSSAFADKATANIKQTGMRCTHK